jgi:hypothetical protein
MYDVFSGRTSLIVNLNAPETNVVLDNEGTETDGCTKDVAPLQTGTGMRISICLHELFNCLSNRPVTIPSVRGCEGPQPPKYKLSRTIATVHDLWREWSIGIGGRPAVKVLEDTWGAKWRKDTTERRFFNRRRIVIDEVNRIASDDGVTIEEAIRRLDDKMKASSKSLDWLQKQIVLSIRS